MNELGLSTINTKGSGLNKSEKLRKISQVFERLNQSMPGGAKNASNNFAALGDRFTKSGNLIYIPQETEIPVLICKKAKRSGADLIREATISRKDVFSFIQKKSQKKHYTTPLDFIAESKEDFDKTSQGANKKSILPWQAKEIADKPFRIRFRRHVTAQPDAPSDTAFYFQNREDMKKMMNFLKGIKLLENIPDGQTSLHAHIAKLDKIFKAQMILKLKQAIEDRAAIAQIANSLQKEEKIKQSPLLSEFNKNIQLKLFTKWKEIASFNDSTRKQQAKETKDRHENLKIAVNSSKMLDSLNQRLMLNLQDAWKAQALARSQPQKEDINILFNILEIANTINNPTVTVNVRLGREITEPVRLNGKVLHGRSRDFKLSCEFKEANRRTTKAWRIFGGPGDMSEDQKRFVRENYVATALNLSGEKFSLHFEDFPLEKLKNVDITIKVLDDRNSEKAYYSTSLKLFQIASKRGKNIWVCLSTNKDLDKQYPLIHFKIESRAIKNRSNQLAPTTNVSNNKARKFASSDFVEDTFYNYRFKFPVIAPNQKSFLELLPTSWDIIDQKTRELESSSKSLTDYIQRIKYKLSKHYHETTTRQLALLKKSAYLWAELQDDIFTYLPGGEYEDKSPLYANEQFLRDVTNTARATTPAGKVYGQTVSCLFKRDLWESKAEWRRFYTELEALCQRGIPPQYRLDMWSEMSRVVYFVRLTEKHLSTSTDEKLAGVSQKVLSQGDEDTAVKSENLYNILFERSHKHFSPLYQELEDDIQLLRESFEVAQLPYEKSIRNICRTFIFWSHQFSDPAKGENTRYYINYSRTIATLCYGLLVCQNCTFIEGNDVEEEQKVFWLLIALCCYIFSSYFQTNEQSVGVDNLTLKKEEISRRRNNLVNSAARCNHMRGIRSDLLLLKFLLRDYEQDIYHKFEELGLPLEYYFGDHMLNLFFSLYNPGLTFRIWDILFFEGSSANQVKCNRMIVCLIFTLLRECKQQILRAKDAGDIKLIIDIYAKFQTNHGEFIRKSYQVCHEYLEQTVPPNNTIMEKLNYINFAFFNKDYNKFDKKIQSVEGLIEKHFHNTFVQNEAFYKFAHQKYKYRPEFSPEIISYPVLSELIRKFALRFGNPILAEKSRIKQSGIHSARDNKPQTEDGKYKRLLRDQIKKIWVKVYRIASKPEYLQQTSLRLGYGKNNLAPLKDYNPQAVGLEGVFEIAGGSQEGALRDLKIEVWTEKDALYPKKLRTATVDLKALPVNIISKLNLRFNEEEHDIYTEDYVSSEVEVAILLEAPQLNPELHKASGKHVDPLLIPELEDINYKDYKGINLQQAITTEISKQEGISENALNNYSVIRRPLFSWKENFAIQIDDFINALSSIAPYWGPKDLKNICQLITQASRNNLFYASDFFVLLIVNAKGTTLSQKFTLLYDLFSSFEGNFAPSAAGDISLDTFKGLAGYLYEVFMIHIPHNQLENIIELATTGNVSCVKQVVINEEVSEAKVEYPKRVLNRISNYIHLYHNTKDVHVQSSAILKLLREIYEKEILSTAEGRRSILPQNTIDIIYMTDGRNHRLTLNVDQSWRPLDAHKSQGKGATSSHETARLLGTYLNVLGLNTPPKVFSKEKFIETLQKLPLLNYLFSLENLEHNASTIALDHVKYAVVLGNDILYSVNVDKEASQITHTSTSTTGSKKKTKFLQYLINWPAFVRKATSDINSPTKPKSGFHKIHRVAGTSGNISPAKLDISLPYAKILQNIKRSLIKEISNDLNHSWTNVGSYHPKLFNELLYTLGFDVTVKVNKNHVYEKVNSDGSPFLSLLDAAENLLSSDEALKDLEIIFSLKTSTIPDPYVEPYNQLALYRYTDGSSEWLPCKIRYKYSFGNIDAQTQNAQVDGYGVVFERYPLESVLRKTSEVIIRDQVDLNELELKKVDKRTSRATTIDQVPGLMHKSNTFTKHDESMGL